MPPLGKNINDRGGHSSCLETHAINSQEIFQTDSQGHLMLKTPKEAFLWLVMYICVCVCVHACACVCTCVCLGLRVHMHVYVCKCVCVHVCMCLMNTQVMVNSCRTPMY